MSNWLITGGCGFIGRNLIQKLLSDSEAAIRVLDNETVCDMKDLQQIFPVERVAEGNILPAKGKVQLLSGDIRDNKVAAEACHGMDIVVHLAANTGVPKSVANPELDFETNAMGTFNMLEATRHQGLKRFIFASSGAPAGTAKPPVTEKSLPEPISPYGASKLAGEGYCSAYHHCFGLDTVALRFSNVYGPYSSHKTSVVAKLLSAISIGEDWTIYGDGTQTRDFLYVDDLVEAILLAAYTRGIGGHAFQIATGVEHSLRDLMDIIQKSLAKRGLSSGKIIHENSRQGDMPRNYADPSKAAKMLGWKAETNLEDGIRETVDWFFKTSGGHTTK